jgi:hypothetical protein
MSSSYHLIRLEGYLDIGRYPEIRRAFEEAPPTVPVLVDLLDAVGVDSVFLSEMLLFKRRHRPHAVAVVIPPGGHLAKLFGIASVGEKMNVFTNLSSAIQSLGLEENPEDPPTSADGAT